MSEKYPLALPEGSVLAGEYVIEKILGQGGFGITYKAKDHKTGRYVAVKEFFPDSMATRASTSVVPFTGDRGDNYLYGKECFLQEAETLAKFIGNENIVRVYSYFEENGTAYFVMDYIEGTSFDMYIKQQGGKVSFDEAYRILSPVMDALAAVHGRGIIHRDVTPDNIYITNDGTVKLLDFGAARYSLGDKSQSLDVVLKHGFAPKEQYVRRGRQGAFTDVYALGATFYFALTGKRPPDSIDRMEEDKLIPPSALGVQIPSEAEKAILMALNVRPEDRFQTMQAFKSAMGVVFITDSGTQPTVTQRFFTSPVTDTKIRNNPTVTAANASDDAVNSVNKVNATHQPDGIVSKVYGFIDANYQRVKIIICCLFGVLSLLLLISQRNISITHTINNIEYGSMSCIVQWALIISNLVIIFSVYKDFVKGYVLGFTIGIAGIALYLAYWLSKVNLENTIEIVSYSYYGTGFIFLGVMMFILLILICHNKSIPVPVLYAVCFLREIMFFHRLNQSDLEFKFLLPMIGVISYSFLIIILLHRKQNIIQ